MKYTIKVKNVIGNNVTKATSKSVRVFTLKESIIGGGLITAGFTYLIKKAFEKGANETIESVIDMINDEGEQVNG